MRSLCVFCGSNPGNHPRYLVAARELGALLARENITLVYGGGRVGLMGAMADAALKDGGKVVGVIPQLLLDKEVGHTGLTDLHVVDTMARRKQVMGDLSDAFLTLPGGIGTMDELFEAWTWTQLELHRKPCGIFNQEGYYDPLLAFVDRCIEEGFLRPRHQAALLVDNDLERLVAKVREAATA